MDALQWSTGVHALAMTLAQSMTTEELTQASLLFTQLGTTLATIAALQGFNRREERKQSPRRCCERSTEHFRPICLPNRRPQRPGIPQR